LLAGLFSAPALATEPPVPAPTPTATSAPATNGAESTSVLQVSPELSLALEVVEGPVRNDADGTYSVTYELVVTQSGSAEIEPLSLLGFTTTSDVVSNESSLEQNAELASEDAETGAASAESTVAPEPTTAAAEGTAASTATAIADASAPPEPTTAPAPMVTPAPTATATAAPVPEIKVESGIGIAKRIVSPPKIVDGAFEFTYGITVQNTGDDAVTKLRVVDNLVEVFGPDATIEILGVATDGQIRINNAYDGVDDVELVAAGSTLAAGKMARLSVSVSVLPSELGVYEMNAAAAGVSASGVNLIDVSTDGTAIDADGDDDSSDDSEPTAVSLASEQSLELGLRVLRNAAEASAGVFSGTLALTIKNPGPFEVEELQVHEAFAEAGDTKLVLESATSDTLSVNPWFDGRTEIALLSGEDSLAVGASGVVVLELTTSFDDLQDVQQLASAEAIDSFGVAVKAGTGEVLAAAPAGYTKSDSAAADGASTDAEPATTSARASEPVAKSPAATSRSAEPDIETEPAAETAATTAGDFEVAAAALEPPAVSGALRLQYQVAIAGMIALVLALVGGGTAAGINRRERHRSQQVSEWLTTQ